MSVLMVTTMSEMSEITSNVAPLRSIILSVGVGVSVVWTTAISPVSIVMFWSSEMRVM